LIIYTKFSVKRFGELTSPQTVQSATWLAASWFVGELSGYRIWHKSHVVFHSSVLL